MTIQNLRDFLDEMRWIYLSTEQQLLEFEKIIPLNNPDETYSPRLYSILQLTCSQIESMMKRFVSELNLKPKKDDFPSRYHTLNFKKGLSFQKVLLVPARKVYMPFNEDNSSHEWWIGYNNTKHSLPEGIQQGNLKNTINALAGLYILHNIGFVLSLGKEKDALDPDNWESVTYAKNYEKDVAFLNSVFTEASHHWHSKLFHHTTSWEFV